MHSFQGTYFEEVNELYKLGILIVPKQEDNAPFRCTLERK